MGLRAEGGLRYGGVPPVDGGCRVSSFRRQRQPSAQRSVVRGRAESLGGRPGNAAAQDRLRARGLSPRTAQEALARLGFGREVADVWDADRRASLADFQRALGLVDSGELDPPTEMALQHAITARVSFRELLAIAPELEHQSAAALLPGVNTGMARADVSNDQRKAAFLAQVAQESGSFTRMEGDGSGLLPVRGDAGWGPVELGQATAERWSSGGFNALADLGRFAEIGQRLGAPAEALDEVRGHVREVLGRSRGNPGFFDAFPPNVVVDEADGPPLLWADAELEADEQGAPPQVPDIGDFL